nr:CD3324 family protein [uncultured Acetatifactor sp.]
MKYVNAAEILPERLLRELQSYIDGDVLYVPKYSSKKKWGTVSGSRSFYGERNREIQRLYREGCSMEALSEEYGLAHSTIRKIIYG